MLPEKYRVLFQEFLFELMVKKVSKDILPKDYIKQLYDQMSVEQQAFHKIVTKKDKTTKPRLIVFEVKTPE